MPTRLSGFVFCIVVLLFSLPITQAQESTPTPFENLEVITPANLDRLVKLHDLDVLNSGAFIKVSFNADSTLLAGNTPTGVWVWSLQTGHAKAIIDKPACDCIFPFGFHSTNPVRLATCGVMWDVNTLEHLFKGDFCNTLAFDPRGHFLVNDNPLSLLDANTGELIRDFPHEIRADGVTTPLLSVCDAAFSPDSKKLAYTATVAWTGEDETIVNVIDLQNGNTQQLPVLGDAARMGNCFPQLPDLHFSSSGRYLYSNIDAGLTIFDTETGEISFETLDYRLGYLTPTPDDQILFDAVLYPENDRRLFAYALHTMEEIPVPSGIADSNISISPDGKLLAAYTDQISIWGIPAQ